MSAEAGHTLGKYQIVERLGRGGMAVVYKAHHPDLDRFVAVKILHPHLAEAHDFQGRFRREAQAVARLRHPNIIQVFDFDSQGEQHYMVMEYIQGQSLKTLLDEGFMRGERMDIHEALRIFRHLLDAVGYAHRSGMVHRDLKPANVMLEADGRPVLTDFGIARLLDASKLTASGVTVGTPAYMSPEQGQGQPGDVRSDIYALGAMLYESLAGTVPFEGDSSVAVVLKHLSAPIPSLRAVRPELPEALDHVVARAMAKDPADRFQSAEEMWAALAPLAGGQATAVRIPAPPPAQARPAKTAPPDVPSLARPRRPWGRLAAAALVLVLLGAAIALGAFILPRLGNPAGAAVARGEEQLVSGEYQLAADAFTAALEQDPRSTQALLGRARAYEQLGQVVEAADDVAQAIEVDPGLALAYAERARLNLQYGLEADPDVLLADFDRALELDPDLARAHFLRGWAILNFPLVDGQPDPQAALANLERAVELEPRNAEAQHTLGQALLRLGLASEALTAARRAVEVEPQSAAHYLLRAHSQAVLGDFHAAIDDLTAAIGLEAGAQPLAVLYSERAYLLYRLQNIQAAEADIAQALATDPDSRLAAFVQVILDPSIERPPGAQVEQAREYAPEDPIWQAVIQDVAASSP